MRNSLRGLAALIALASVNAYALPTPTYGGITVNGSSTINGAETVTGQFRALAGGQLAGTFTGPLTLGSVTPLLTPTTQAGLASLPATGGAFAFVTDCPNGSQSGGGVTGCPAFRDTAGTWRLMPSPSNLPITIGGQGVILGGSTTNQGNGTKIQLATGGFVAGNALVFDAAGNAVDSGVVPSGGTGGGGTVAPGAQGSPSVYLNAGTSSTVGPIPIVANAVMATNGSGFVGEVTTLPTGLTYPSGTFSNPTLTGSISIGTAGYTGKQTFLASVVSSAGLNIPAGVAPSAPAPGDEWGTPIGKFYRVGSVTQGPFIAALTGSGPIAITGGGTALLAAGCPQCALTTNGGLLTATAPMTISAGGLINLGTIFKPFVWLADSSTVVHNDIYPLFKSPWSSPAPISSVIYHVNGTGSSTGSFVASLNTCTLYSGGTCTPVPGCNTLTVASATDTTVSCTAASLPAGQFLNLTISGTVGAPASAWVQTVVATPSS